MRRPFRTAASLPAPHGGRPVATAGVPLGEARAAMLLVHGRGAGAHDILTLAEELQHPGDPFAYLAPQAADRSWYPQSFLAPIAANQPGIDSGLAVLSALLELTAEAGIPARRTLLLGFSQGACLALTLVADRPRRLGGVAGLTGGLIGPPEAVWGAGSGENGDTRPLAGTPVFLGAGDPDPHVPWWRVEETAEWLRRLGGAVTARRYPGLPHTVNEDELQAVRAMMDVVRAEAEGSR